MLTAAQCEVVAYLTDGGFVCRDCAVSRFESEGGEAVADYRPVIQYEADEYASELNSETRTYSDAISTYNPECSDECEPIPLTCDECGGEIVEAYHYGHVKDDEPTGDEVVETAIAASRLLEER